MNGNKNNIYYDSCTTARRVILFSGPSGNNLNHQLRKSSVLNRTYVIRPISLCLMSIHKNNMSVSLTLTASSKRGIQRRRNDLMLAVPTYLKLFLFYFIILRNIHKQYNTLIALTLYLHKNVISLQSYN